MSTPLWKVFATRAALPIGIVVSLLFLVRACIDAVTPSPDELAFGMECTVAGGSIELIGDVTFCVKGERIELATPKTFAELCVEAGGLHKRDVYLGDGDYADECWKFNIVQELGARHEYTANR
jgi:hypothetical protein